MLRKVVLSSVMLAFLSTPVTLVYAVESESINYNVDVNEPKQTTNEYENILYINGTIESIDESGEIKVVSKDINGNVTNELTIKNSKYATVYDMETGKKMDNQSFKVGDEVLVYYIVDEYTNEINATRIFINPDSSNSANSVMFLGDSGSANGTIIDDSANPTKRTFISQDGQSYVTFDENTELTDFNGNPVTVSELNTNDVVLVWYPMMSMSYPSQATATKAILIEDNVKEVKGTETIKLESVIGKNLTTDESGNTVIQAISFYSSKGGEYVFDTSSQIVDDKGNVVSVSDLKTGDILTVDYVGIEENGVKKVNVTNAVVDTTDHSVEGTTSIQLGEVSGGGMYEDENGNMVQDAITFKAEDSKYKYRIQFNKFTEIIDSEGNPLTIADLQTGDTVTVDYVGEELNGEVEAKATKAVVEVNADQNAKELKDTNDQSISSETDNINNVEAQSFNTELIFGTEISNVEENNQVVGTATVKLSDPIVNDISIDDNGNIVEQTIVFSGKDGSSYILPTMLKITDTNGNKVNILDLKSDDILIVDYAGLEINGQTEAIVTKVVLDTTGYKV